MSKYDSLKNKIIVVYDDLLQEQKAASTTALERYVRQLLFLEHLS